MTNKNRQTDVTQTETVTKNYKQRQTDVTNKNRQTDVTQIETVTYNQK